MEDFQDSVIAERDELNVRLKSLSAFIGTETYRGLDSVDRFLMDRQLELMLKYSSILQSRIERF
jgi:hypothetical protein